MQQSTVESDGSGKSTRTRRRLLWIVIFALGCLLLASVVAILWPYLRPLTDSERRVVGTWRNTTNLAVFTFYADRTVTAPGFPPGVWYMREDRLYTPDSFPAEVLQALFVKRVDQSSVLMFEDDGTISVFTPVNGGRSKWRRVR
jgi:hypothetical protein